MTQTQTQTDEAPAVAARLDRWQAEADRAQRGAEALRRGVQAETGALATALTWAAADRSDRADEAGGAHRGATLATFLFLAAADRAALR